MAKKKPRRTRPRRAVGSETREGQVDRPPRFYQQPAFRWTLLSGVLYFLSLPPVGLAWLGWLATMPLLMLVYQPDGSSRGEYRAVWIASFLQWMLILYGIRIAHPWLNVGWVVLSSYLALYNVLFVGLSRVGHHRCQLPLAAVCPIVWVGLEYARGFVGTGFSLALLGHTAIRTPILIQVADLFGAYAVSLVMMTVSVCLFLSWKERSHPKKLATSLATAGILLSVTVAYGYFRLHEQPPGADRGANVVLLQGDKDVIFEYNPQRDLDMFLQYRDQSFKLAASGKPIDVIVWPETTFILPEIQVDADDPPEWPDEVAQDMVKQDQQKFTEVREGVFTQVDQLYRQATGEEHGPQIIIGLQTRVFARRRRFYNTALLLDPGGDIAKRYYKMHPVLFGEVLPLGNIFPFLYKLSPLEMGMSVGTAPVNFEIGELKVCPNICFEITVPHLIRRQFLQVAKKARPDALVNLTNDGWFWGSSILDFQFAGAVFRAVENRVPVLVAANSGITAHIAGDGRIVAEIPRQKVNWVYARLVADGRRPLYHLWGDYPVAACLLIVVVFAIVGFRDRSRGEAT